ncbi:LamG domain-containing protein [Larkinella punicea]|uniref:LamG domain-containing protein n=1 Tax=Larkinella punicea TaxID=2315727 RepID=A0A368JJY5_9BACT|nr:LamG domain-containing protein [Larkinella punicea]RCR66431.1 LamG domain-containing protein [Larkinella punicea]
MIRQFIGNQTLKSLCWLWVAVLGLSCDAWVLPRKQFAVATGPVGYYPLNGSTLDASGNNLHGVLKNGATYGLDRKSNENSALLLDGIDDYFEIPDHVLLRPSVLSISLWIKPQRVTSTTQIYSKAIFKDNVNNQYTARITPPYTTGSTTGYEIIADIEQDGNCEQEDKTKKRVLYFDPGFQLNQWVHIVTVFEGKTGTFYLNGQKQISNTEFKDGPIDACSGSPLRFGVAWEGDLNQFSGMMDDIRIYNRALTESEIKALYQQ